MNHRPLLLVNHRAPAANSGKPTGIANYMLSLTRALLDRGVLDIGLATSWRLEDLPTDIAERIKVYEHRPLMRPRLFDVLRQAFTMPKLARRIGADVILNVDPVGTPLGAKARLTVVHDLYFRVMPEQFPFRERLFSDAILRLMLAGSTAIICVSDRTKADLERFYPSAQSKTHRIYQDAGKGFNLDRVRTSAAPPGGYILWVGNVTANKNLACLYKALRLLSDRGCPLSAVVVGRDFHGHAAAVERQFGAGLNVKRLGYVPDDELKRLYEQALCFVNTSLYEGFGVPIIEAQRSGLPVICSTGGAVGEVAGQGALTFDPNDPAALADHLETLNKSPGLYERLVTRGYANAERFSWDRTAEGIEKLTKLLAEEHV